MFFSSPAQRYLSSKITHYHQCVSGRGVALYEGGKPKLYVESVVKAQQVTQLNTISHDDQSNVCVLVLTVGKSNGGD